MKIKHLLACAVVALGWSSMNAQTDVTSTYLDNAGFDNCESYVSTGVCTYAKDVAGNSADGSSLMAVTSWTAGESGDAKAGGAFSFGSDAWLTGTSFKVPATNSDDKAEGGALGLGGCWDGNAYYTQDLKKNLPAGTYTIEIKGYNAGTATAFGTQTFGIKESDGKTTHYVTTTWTAGQWTTATVSFELKAETAATFYVGATGVAGGSAKSAKLFIDYVKILKAKSLQELMEEATEANPVDVTKFYLQNAAVTGTDGWTNGRVNSGEQYTDAPDKTYLDNWNATLNMNQKVTLKPGKYTLKAATRAVAGIEEAHIYAYVDGGADFITDIVAVGNKDGDLGNGWGWSTVDFYVVEEAEVTIGFYSECNGGKWAGADNFSLLYSGQLTEDDKCLILLRQMFKAAQDIEIPADECIGDEVFQYNKGDVKELKETKETMLAYTEEQMIALLKSKNMYNTVVLSELMNSLENAELELNAPTVDQTYKIVMKYDGWDYDNYAITTMANNRSDAGLYNIQYKAQNPNYAQALYFDVVNREKNTYTISFIDADGETRFFSSGVPYGGNASQIRTTTNAEDALVVKVVRNGAYVNFFNTEADAFIGGQDAGVYTVASHNNFVVEETTSTMDIEKTVAEGKFATIVLPYKADVSGGKAYEAAYDAENSVVTLTEVETLEAGKAYILGEGEYMFSDVSVAYEEPANGELLTGVFTAKAAPVDSYVLQTQDEVQAFYQVPATVAINIPANYAYLTLPSSPAPSAKMISIVESEATAIKAINALTTGNAKIYDLNGRELKSLQKGVNVVNGVKVYVK